MALSGTLNTNSPAIADGRYYQLTWTATQSVANNTSTINWTLKMIAGDPAHIGWIAERTLKVVIDGNTVVNKTDRVERNPGTITSGTLTLNHNTDGSRSFSVSIQAAQYYSEVNTTGSGTFTLDAIPRKAEITSAPDFNDEQNPTITYSNLAGNSVTSLQACISLTGSSPDIAYRDISKTGTSYTFNLTEAERKVLRAATISGGTARTVYFYIKTVIGGITYYHNVAKTLSIINCIPTINPTVEDVNSISLALTGNKNKLIKYVSNAAVAINATARKEATISEVSITCGGKKITTASGTINAVESGSFTFSAKDNRGSVTATVLNKTFIEYVKPTCILTVQTPTAEGKCNITVSGKTFFGSFGVESNYPEIMYRYKKDYGSYTDWEYVDATNRGSNNYENTITITGLDYQSTYTFQARLSDTIMDAYSQEISVRAVPIFDWGQNDFAFNVPVSIQGNLVSDYVIENSTASMGTNGTWKIEKWASGKAVCYGVWNAGNMSISSAWGSWYENPTALNRSFPAGLFVAAPEVLNIDVLSSGSAGFVSRGAGTQISASNTGDFYICRPTSITLSQVKISFYAVGRWK